MQLCVDIGNTRVKTALFKGFDLIQNTVSEDEAVYVIKDVFEAHADIDSIIISSVKEGIDIDLIPIPETIHHILLDHETPLPINNLYESKETLGHDRIALAVGAQVVFPQKACLVFDIGTCLTMDFVSSNSDYLGGSISPGIQMRLNAMHSGTAKLPKVSFNQEEAPILGKNTEDCMKSGAVNGMLNEIRGAIKEFKAEFIDLEVIITGGDLKLFDKALKSTIFADPNIVLRGLNKILLHNIEKP